MNHPLRHPAVDNPLLIYSVQRQNFLAAYFSGKQHVKGTLINQLGMEHHSVRFRLWLQELLFPALHMTAPHLEALRDVLTVYERNGAPVLQAYTPQEDRLFREVLPLPTFRPEVSYRDAGLLRTSRNFILPCAHWMCIPSDFVGITQSGLMVLPPTLHGRFFDHGLQIPNFSFCPRASINLALFGFKMNEGNNLPTSHSRLLLFQIQLQSDHLIPELLRLGPGTNFWNRTYFDYFLKVREGFGFSALELSTSQVYVVGQETSGQLAQNVLGRAPHTLRHFDAPFFRYQHLLLPESSWNNFYQLSGRDEYIPPQEVEHFLRSKM